MFRKIYPRSPRAYSQLTGRTITRQVSDKSGLEASTSPGKRRLLPNLIAPTLEEPPFTWTQRYAIYFVAAGLGGHVFLSYFYSLEPAYGISMLPTISSFGDWVLLSKYYRRGRGVKVGDVVSFKHPVREGEYAVKRVIGMEGDFVLMNTPGKSDAVMQVPEGHFWVVGDNLEHSRDSRMFGPLPLALLNGKVIAIVRSMQHIPLPTLEWVESGLQAGYINDDVD